MLTNYFSDFLIIFMPAYLSVRPSARMEQLGCRWTDFN
jgi:hypothetical protein